MKALVRYLRRVSKSDVKLSIIDDPTTLKSYIICDQNIDFTRPSIFASTNHCSCQRRGRLVAGVSQSSGFDCPEEFGYYSHPSDCTQYYVCVFGGALLESCTGGLMYSHELQTCDWPRNVGCGSEGASATVSTVRVTDPRTRHTTPTGQSPSRSTSGALRIQNEQQKRQQQEEIAKHQLYADDLGPAEEIESDRQQRVYRGQPSILGQVARDRDGLRHKPVSNTLSGYGEVHQVKTVILRCKQSGLGSWK
uniref:Chitin-binding type-2 domain-containing protein n=1 Tax=Timema poppense TaxID=170557 RepID=A0A7R9GV27_TIMPO|nr:unnamed protein product [Timema poppensis]